MGGMVYADGKLVATVFGHLVKLRPRTYLGWFLATFSLKRYPLVLRYRVHLDSRARGRLENHTFNSAATTIIEALQKYPKGTTVGFAFAMYGPDEMHRITYRTVFDLRSIAIPVLALIRDFFTDSNVTREELGDESLDHVAKVRPVGIGGSELVGYWHLPLRHSH